jgi:hypothetical protein
MPVLPPPPRLLPPTPLELTGLLPPVASEPPTEDTMLPPTPEPVSAGEPPVAGFVTLGPPVADEPPVADCVPPAPVSSAPPGELDPVQAAIPRIADREAHRRGGEKRR